MQLVQDKAIIEEEMGELEQEIDDQRERHAVQMQKNLMEQEKLKQGILWEEKKRVLKLFSWKLDLDIRHQAKLVQLIYNVSTPILKSFYLQKCDPFDSWLNQVNVEKEVHL